MAILRFMLLFLSILGIFLALILLYFSARKYRSSLFLGLFFLFTSLYGFYQYILLYSKSVTLISLFLFNLSLVSSPVYLIGPMLYFYVRSILTDNSKLKRSDLWHFLPMLFYFVSALPNAFVPWHEKVEVARTVVNDPEFIMVYKATLLSKIFPAFAIFLSRLLLILCYTLLSIGLFINFLVKKKSSSVLSKQHFMKKWLCLFLGFSLILEVTQILLVIKAFDMHFSDLFFTLNIFRVISGIGLIGLLISPFFFPTILYGLPQVPESTIPTNPEDGNSEPLPEEERNSTNHFETNYLNSIGRKADLYMEEFKPYLHPDFNLAQLSVNTQIPVHHIGYFFREVKKQHFIEYRNEWRINHAKKLIREGKANEITLEAVGFLSGFSSRNTFLTTFKKVEGITPSTFAAQSKN